MRFGGGQSYVGNEYSALKAALEDGFDMSDESAKSAEMYGYAAAFGALWACNGRLSNQWQPMKMMEALPAWEEACGLKPSANDLPVNRRRVLAAKRRGYAGNAIPDIEGAVNTLLGSNYGGVYTVDEGDLNDQLDGDTVVFWPNLDPGPPSYEWYSNRATLYIEIERGTQNDSDFNRLTTELDRLMLQMLPAWMSYEWYIDRPFRIDVSRLGEDAA